MIMIADSGSTKTTWVLLDQNSIKKSVTTQGLNPYFTPPDLMKSILADEFVPRVSDIPQTPISRIWFYGAGCSTSNNNNLINSTLLQFFPDAVVSVEHDILGAARALFNRESGIACILGTGSNSCFYDGKEVFTNVPSLGYLFGDEGAGSNLGKKLMERYLKNRLPDDIREAFDQRYKLTLEDILNALYNQPFPNRFLASFTWFLKDHSVNPEIHELIYSSFISFIEAHITRYDHYARYPAGFIGSIATVFEPILREAAADEAISVGKIIQNPIEGLISYHSTP
jgi:glucosamine kinase